MTTKSYLKEQLKNRKKNKSETLENKFQFQVLGLQQKDNGLNK